MSLSRQNGTCIVGRRLSRLRMCPKNNVRFVVYSPSLLTIIDGMKGLIYSASFCVPSGTEKSLTHFQVKDDFFVPGDTVDVQQDLFFQRAVAGPTLSLIITEHQHALATVLLSLRNVWTRGRFRLPLAPVVERSRAGHCFFLRPSFLSKRSAVASGCCQTPISSCRPLFIS